MEGPREIVPGVYGLGSEKVNWYLVESGGELTAVDAGLPAFAGSLDGELAQFGFAASDVKALVLTHSDGDHTGLARTLSERGARVLVHEQDEETLRKPRAKPGEASPQHLLPYLVQPGLWTLMLHMGRRGGAKPVPFEGAATFSGGERLEVPGRPLAIHTPGHTEGHCARLFEEHGALFVGDELCTWNPVFWTKGPQLMPKAFSISRSRCLHSLIALEGLQAEVVLPGHGEPFRGSPAEAVAEARRTA